MPTLSSEQIKKIWHLAADQDLSGDLRLIWYSSEIAYLDREG